MGGIQVWWRAKVFRGGVHIGYLRPYPLGLVDEMGRYRGPVFDSDETRGGVFVEGVSGAKEIKPSGSTKAA
jgi:hypothetical protein